MPPIPPDMPGASSEHHESASEVLSAYDQAAAEFDHDSAVLLDTACEMVVLCSETGEIGEDLTVNATAAILSMRKLLVEAWQSSQDPEHIESIARDVLATHDAERVDLFNQLMGEGSFDYVGSETLEETFAVARETHGINKRFIQAICDDYAGWLQFDLEVLADTAATRYEQKMQREALRDSGRQALVAAFYDSFSARLTRWPEYDPQDPEHLDLMQRKLTYDADKYIDELGFRYGTPISVGGCSAVSNGETMIAIAEDVTAEGILSGYAVGPIYTHDSETSEATLTHTLGLYLTVAAPKLSNSFGDPVEVSPAHDTGSLMFPILNDGVRMVSGRAQFN